MIEAWEQLRIAEAMFVAMGAVQFARRSVKLERVLRCDRVRQRARESPMRTYW